MHVTSLGAAREIQEGIAVDPLLVGCGLKTHDFDPNEVWKIVSPKMKKVTTQSKHSFRSKQKRRLSAFFNLG